MHLGVCFRTQLNYLTTAGLLEARFEALSEEAFRLVLLSERRSPPGTGPHTLFMVRRFFPTQDGVDISYSWPRESSVCCLWLVLPLGVGGCVCACMFTPADHSPRGRWARWGAGGGEPPAVSRAHSRALSLPPAFLWGCARPRPPRPRKTRGLCLHVAPAGSSADSARQPSQGLPCLLLRRGSLSCPEPCLKRLLGGG